MGVEVGDDGVEADDLEEFADAAAAAGAVVEAVDEHGLTEDVAHAHAGGGGGGGGLPAAGFAGEAEGLAGGDGERDAVDGVDPGGGALEEAGLDGVVAGG